MLRSGEPRRSAVVGAIARGLSVDNRRDHDPNVPIRKPSCRPSMIRRRDWIVSARTDVNAPRGGAAGTDPTGRLSTHPIHPHPATCHRHPATSTAAGDAAPRRPTVAATARERLTHARARSHRDIKCPGADLRIAMTARFVSRGTSQAARAYNDVRSQRCTGATAAKCLATKSTNADFSRTAGGLPSQPACSPPCRSSAARG